jgi:hypothetical protein
MLVIYRKVLAQEKKLAQFGAAALNLRKKKNEIKKKKADDSNVVSHPRGKSGAPGNEKEENNADDEEEGSALNDGAHPVSSKEEESTTTPTIYLQNLLCRPFRLLTKSIRKTWKERPVADVGDDEEEALTLIASMRKKFWEERRVDSRSSTATSGRSRSNNTGWQTRAVMNKALSYSLAFFLSYLFPIIISIRTLAGIYSGQTLSVMARVLFPLQGFFNFVVFIHPKVVTVKNNGKRRGAEESISWFRAFVKVITVREQQQGLNRRHNNNPLASTKNKGGRAGITAVITTISSFFSSVRNLGGGMMKKKASSSASSSLRKNKKERKSAASSTPAPANSGDANDRQQ